MKHVLKEKVSYCQVPPDYIGNPLTYKHNDVDETSKILMNDIITWKSFRIKPKFNLILTIKSVYSVALSKKYHHFIFALICYPPSIFSTSPSPRERRSDPHRKVLQTRIQQPSPLDREQPFHRHMWTRCHILFPRIWWQTTRCSLWSGTCQRKKNYRD